MEIVIGSAIAIRQPTEAVNRYCKDFLRITNPDYLNKLKTNRWIGNTPEYLHLYERRGNTLIVPFGCKDDIVALAQECNAPIWWSKYKPRSDFEAYYFSNINLYEYQEAVVKAMIKAKHGVVIMPCGSGKTQTALECIDVLGLKTLWLTHTQDLLNQSMERAKSCFGCDDDMFGAITAGKVKISKGITFATVQTMCKLDLSQYQKEWACIVVDECQHCCGSPTRVTQFYKVVNSLYAPYKFGLTATPERNDGLSQSMYALLGGVITEVKSEDIAYNICPVNVDVYQSGYTPDVDTVTNGDGTLNYSSLVNALINDEERFSRVSKVISSECKSLTIVLANRVQYLQRLQAVYPGKSVCISSMGKSQKAKQERKEALQKLNDGEIDCVFATYQLAAEGLDCPNLRYVVFATPEKDERIVTQAVGRVSRKVKGKECGTVIDFVDDFGMYKSWFNKRFRYYSKLSADVSYVVEDDEAL